MTTRHLTLAVSSSMAVICWISCLAVADGIELRSSTGNRTIIRTVSTAQSQPESESEVKPEVNASEYVDETMILDESVVFDESVGYEAGSCPGAPGCATGCATGCSVVCLPVALPRWPTLHFIDGWAELDYLLWWRDERSFPALVTTEPNSGVLPDATILFGGGSIDEQVRPGGRLDAGIWLDPCESLGLGVRYLSVGESPIHYAIDSDTLGFFARPFFDASTDPSTPTAFPVANSDAQPLPTIGNLTIDSQSEFHAGDAYIRWVLRRNCAVELDLLFGYQYARIDEDLSIHSTTITPRGELSESLEVTDIFDTKNEYNAGYFGLQADYRRCNWGVDVLARFGFGNMHQTVSIDGMTVATDTAGGVDVRASGLLAQEATNGGVHVQDDFAFMTDAGVKLYYCATDRFKLSVGYSLMYFSSVVRPGNHVNLNVDSRLLGDPPDDPDPPIIEPAFSFDTTDYLLQGINLGAEFAF